MGLLDELKRLAKPYDDDDDYENFTPKAAETAAASPRGGSTPIRSVPVEDKKCMVLTITT